MMREDRIFCLSCLFWRIVTPITPSDPTYSNKCTGDYLNIKIPQLSFTNKQKRL